MRAQIEERLKSYVPHLNPKFRTLRDLKSPLSASWLAFLNKKNTESAVLVPIQVIDSKLHLIFTKRNENLKSHAGQICFPGGRIDNSDKSIEACALRESYEEINIQQHQVKVLGKLDSFITGTGFQISPIVGMVDSEYELQIKSKEVEKVFSAPLDFFLEKKNQKEKIIMRHETQFRIYEFYFEDLIIWGATASIIMNLIEVIQTKTI